MGTPKIWTEENIKKAKELQRKGLTCIQIADKLNKSKNSVSGILYREKLKTGHKPIARHLASVNEGMNVYFKKLGKRDCMMCEKKFDTYGKFDKFCETCKKSNYFRGNEIYV